MSQYDMDWERDHFGWLDLSDGIQDASFLHENLPTLARYCPHAFDCAIARQNRGGK